MCCTRLAGNAGGKNSPKIRRLGTITQLCQAISSQLKHVSTIGNKLVKRLRSFRQFGAPQLISTGFMSWRRYCTAQQQRASAKLCGIEQRHHVHSAGQPSCWALAHILVSAVIVSTFMKTSYLTLFVMSHYSDLVNTKVILALIAAISRTVFVSSKLSK